jgi:hypothetical protein
MTIGNLQAFETNLQQLRQSNVIVEFVGNLADWQAGVISAAIIVAAAVMVLVESTDGLISATEGR